MIKFIALMFVGMAIWAWSGRAETYYVATNGVDSRSGTGDWTNALATVSNAVLKATSDGGGIVLVSGGTYLVQTQINIGAAVAVRGVNGAEQTVIRGQYPSLTNRCLYLNHTSAVFEGFTLTGAGTATNVFAEANYGGGAYLNYGLLRDCIVVSNVATRGGGVHVAYGIVTNCIIRANTGFTPSSFGIGGGLSMTSSLAKAYGCLIVDNIATGIVTYGIAGGVFLSGALLADSTVVSNCSANDGGGLQVFGNAIISNCVVANNRAPYNSRYGGGLAFSAGMPLMVGSVVSGNYAGSVGGGIYVSSSCTPRLDDCLIAHNTGTSYGGGIVLGSASGGMILTNCVISNNLVVGGGGGGINAGQYANAGVTAVWCRIVNNIASNASVGAGLTVRGCLIENCVIQGNMFSNRVSVYGAGIHLNAGSGVIRNCLITGNSADGTSGTTGNEGGGIYVVGGGNYQIANCTVVSNFAKLNGSGIYLDGAGSDSFTNCIIADNWTSAGGAEKELFLPNAARSNAFYYSCARVLNNAAQGNITNTPLWMDASVGDYRLQAVSPGVHAGENALWMRDAVDLNGYSRIDRIIGRVDMGCYEHLPQGMLFKSR